MARFSRLGGLGGDGDGLSSVSLKFPETLVCPFKYSSFAQTSEARMTDEDTRLLHAHTLGMGGMD